MKKGISPSRHISVRIPCPCGRDLQGDNVTLPDSKNRQRSRSIARVLNDDASLINIKTFAIAARYMSFKAAARHLGLTSGAVSHRIARLEKELGFPLFNRLTRAVTLTPEGERLRDVYLNAFQKIYEEITQLLQDDFSSLTIYAAPSLALAWLIPQLSDFQQRYPSMQLHVRTGNAPIDFHGDSTVDVALYYAESHVSGLTSRKFMDEATLPVCSPEYAQKHDLIGHPENLPACTLLHDSAAWHYAATTAEWQEWADRNHVDISNCLNFVTFDHTYGASVAASHGLGVALGRCSLIAPLLAEQKLVTPFPDLPPTTAFRSYYAAWPRHTNPSPKLQGFLDWLEEKGQQSNAALARLMHA